jgi:hypothetical protein
MKITGSLYVKATLPHPRRVSTSAICAGEAASASVSSSRDSEISPVLTEPEREPTGPKGNTDVPADPTAPSHEVGVDRIRASGEERLVDPPGCQRVISVASRRQRCRNPKNPGPCRMPVGLVVIVRVELALVE